jgi:hypothetical protein
MNKLRFPKPKRKKTGKKPATVAELIYMRRVLELGCIVTGYYGTGLTLHHVRRYGEKRNHYKVIPLHRSYHLEQEGKDSIESSLADFEFRHGTQESLLIKVYERLLRDGGLPAPAQEIYEKLKEGDKQCG